MTDEVLPGEEPIGFSIAREDGDHPPTVRLEGELDLRAATELREEILRALSDGGGSVRLDMTRLSFLDSTIISVLIMAKRRAEQAGGEVTLRNVPARVKRVFSITGIDELFPTEGS
jgi:anti-sigma B factor antagonist